MRKDGQRWTQEEEKVLKELFYNGEQYCTMSKVLDRSWFACKCRLMKMRLLPFTSYNSNKGGIRDLEKYDTPLNHVQKKDNMFTDEELDIVVSYFKTRLAKLALQKLDTQIFQKGLDISIVEDIFISELSKIKNARFMATTEREKFLMKLA